jgi:L-lactate dehydrogenase complex protein LldG
MESPRNRIIQKIRTALGQPSPMPHPELKDDLGLFQPLEEDLVVHFAVQFKENLGQFVFCETWEEAILSLEQLMLAKGWRQIFCQHPKLQQIFQAFNFTGFSEEDDLQNQVVAGTCEGLIARTGSILVGSSGGNRRSHSILPHTHIVFATTDQVFETFNQALQHSQKKKQALPSMWSLISGPSRTADIEKTLVQGAHGPKELFLFLVEP